MTDPSPWSAFIPGKPRTKNRRRAFVIRGKARVVAAKGQAEMVAGFQAVVCMHRPLAPFEGPVSLRFEFAFPVPKSWPRWKREAALAGAWRHVGVPDTSRLSTFAEDCLSGIVFMDDRQVVRLEARKVYSRVPGTYVHVARMPQARGPNGR